MAQNLQKSLGLTDQEVVDHLEDLLIILKSDNTLPGINNIKRKVYPHLSATSLATRLTPHSIIVDSNVVIAIEKQALGLPLQAGEQAILNKLAVMGSTDLRIASASIPEVTNRSLFGRLLVDKSSPEFMSLLKVLESAGVGRTKGVVDRMIVAEAFFAEGTQATLFTLDKGIYNTLAALAGHNPAKLGKAVPLAFPDGFLVRINGRTIRVIPVKQ